MSEQVCDAHFPPKFNEMSVNEIIAHFARYQFVDQERHKLELCDDFIRLVETVAKKA
ncbi:hypothetical protein NMW79_05190 [Pasteurella multocida]|uniref:Uncharacterized protein n=1 Tax=Pasteurella canis TaxID=753 RepID=A0A379EUA9_9PAST|nr:hypothetical protein [Pasteurella canis]MDY0685671.1 hypothetical protein [Pasteurella multocida]SUC09916.1 Uncharacterised protein [Pasteurella canis]VEI57674.1 Uncharacterised protein [Pasteurella multocida]